MHLPFNPPTFLLQNVPLPWSDLPLPTSGDGRCIHLLRDASPDAAQLAHQRHARRRCVSPPSSSSLLNPTPTPPYPSLATSLSSSLVLSAPSLPPPSPSTPPTSKRHPALALLALFSSQVSTSSCGQRSALMCSAPLPAATEMSRASDRLS